MKDIISLITLLLVLTSVYGQEITGNWNGLLSVQGTQLRLVFNISKSDEGYSATMDSPDQGANGIPVNTVSFENSNLKLEVTNAGIVYEGTLNKNGDLEGVFKQAGQEFPLNLSTKNSEKEIVTRPQNPKEPFPYLSENLKFKNSKDNINLAGTLTLPKKDGTFPVVILISGSGPQDRNSEVFGHKPFLVLSDYLTKNGIAVLRFDDRGTAESEGDFSKATTNDFASDVKSAVKYLRTRKEINNNKIGLIGHSEGGIVAPIVASNNLDVDFIVLLAGPGIRGDKLMLSQKEKIERQSGADELSISQGQDIFGGAYEIIVNSKLNDDKLVNKINEYFKDKFQNALTENQINSLTNQLTSPWMINFMKLDPSKFLEKVKCPVLAINGDKDLQVPSEENLKAIAESLKRAGDKNVTINKLKGLNHLFQECKTGLPSEYGQIEQTISPNVLDIIKDWILKQTK